MIKFFSRNRQNLIMENKTSKYIKYAFGEIVLVVIGILIALQINNWNQDRINSKKERHYLIGLKNDLKKQLKEFEIVDNFFGSVSSISESILVDYSLKGNLMEVDSLNLKLSKIMYTRHYPEINTTFNELNTTGQLDLVKDPNLRSKIIEYYQNSKSLNSRVNGNIKDVFYADVFPVLRSAIIVELENFNIESNVVKNGALQEQLNSIYQSNLISPQKAFEVINAVGVRILVASTNAKYVDQSANEATLLLKDIEHFLKYTTSNSQ